jgi:hypothetical protein
MVILTGNSELMYSYLPGKTILNVINRKLFQIENYQLFQE